MGGIALSNLSDVVAVGRGDPIYMAHGYLTKVPVSAIMPFIEEYTAPGDVVLDVFAGSGMTGVAATALGRRAELSDISRLGQHIGQNYVNLVDPLSATEAAERAMKRAEARLGDLYAVTCGSCSRTAQLAKTVHSITVPCRGCGKDLVFYDVLERAGWSKSKMRCECGESVSLKAQRRNGEVPVVDYIDCSCKSTQIEQPPSGSTVVPTVPGLTWPDVEIGSDRQMYAASALGLNGLTSTAKFFSRRNLAVLAVLKQEIDAEPDDSLRQKLTFAFTGILARASKRYQWSPQRPLNASNQNYYIAAVFYEWNVYDLFARKVRAVIKSDNYLRELRRANKVNGTPDVHYRIASAHNLSLPDDCIDYVFTDPPFGSNIFYSDMNLFHEAWLGQCTDHEFEAVVDRSGSRDADRYESLITGALRECHRVLKAEGKLSLVFSNSSGRLWALVQRAVRQAGFEIDGDGIHLLDKGQRSVKGLASGFENVVTMDLILTMHKAGDSALPTLHEPSELELEQAVKVALNGASHQSPTHVYLSLLRQGLRSGWSLSRLDFALVAQAVRHAGYVVDPASGRFITRGETAAEAPAMLPTF
jgi:16S rRNA G966 N2-methylase RsmD